MHLLFLLVIFHMFRLIHVMRTWWYIMTIPLADGFLYSPLQPPSKCTDIVWRNQILITPCKDRGDSLSYQFSVLLIKNISKKGDVNVTLSSSFVEPTYLVNLQNKIYFRYKIKLRQSLWKSQVCLAWFICLIAENEGLR